MDKDDLSARLMQSFFQLLGQKRRVSRVQGMNPGELRVLLSLKRFDRGEGVMVSQLSACLGVTPPFITQMTNTLVKKGLVDRARDPADRRAVRLRLTPGGTEILKKGQEELSARFRGLVRHLGPQQSEALIELLEQARKYFDSPEGDGDA